MKFKRLTKIFTVLLAMVFLASTAFGSVGVKAAGVNKGIATTLNFVGATVTGSATKTITTNAISSGTIDGAVIGGITPAAGTFTTLTANTSFTLNGQTITSLTGVVSPWTNAGTTTTLNATPSAIFATHATGVLSSTGFSAGTADVVLENAQIIDGGTNGAFIFTETSDSLTMTATGNDFSFDVTDGGIIFSFTDATDGTFDIMTNNDQDDYVQVSTSGNQSNINFVGQNGSITADTGTIDFGNEILTTTGAISVGAATVTSIIIGDDTLDVVVDDILRFASNDESSTIEAYGFDDKDGILALVADTADDNGDTWILESDESTNSLIIQNDTTGSQVAKLTINTAGLATFAGDIAVNGGDITAQSATASKPVLWLENIADDATAPSIILENDRATEADGDDAGTIFFRVSDSGDATFDAVTILGEATDITAGTEAGSLTIDVEIADTATEMLKMFGDAGAVSTGHVEINGDTADVDFHVDSDDQADLFLIDAGTNDLTLTRNLAAGASTDGPILVVTNTSATGDVGVASFLNAASASSTAPAVLIQSSAAGVVNSSLFINHDGTAGATTQAAVVIDTEDVDTAALYITSPVDATGTTSQIDDYVVAIVAEGIGGGASIYRNVTGSTEALVNIRDVHADGTSPSLVVTTGQDATADDAAVQFITTSAAFDQPVVLITQAGVTDTNFKLIATFGTTDIYESDGTTADGNLTGVVGDICFNGSSVNGGMAFCDVSGTNWTDM